MRQAYLECFSGISGDMFLGALIDAGVSTILLEQTIEKLGLPAKLRISRVDRSGISATSVEVLVNGVPAEAAPHMDPSNDASEHAHAHAHSHSHEHASASAPSSHQHEKPHSSHHGRTFAEIRHIIQRASLSAHVANTALRAFELLAAAEGKIHQKPPESVHFHEVGAVDAIVDIVCAAAGADALGIDKWICSPVNVGSGTVHCAHGVFPVPAPATVELLLGLPVYAEGPSVELATPTGAALIRALNCQAGPFPPGRIETVGYGAGARNFPARPNVLRLSIGEAAKSTCTPPLEKITILETTLDDLTPQILGYVSELLLQRGARDVFVLPAQMKKNRPGSLLTVLCDPVHADALIDLLFAETTTLGIRTREEYRHTLDRRFVNVQSPWGEVRIKEALRNGVVTNYAPEYEDCRRLAEACSRPLREVQQAVIQSYLNTRKSS
jgi:uncharacterized protein (TIGR00299 family) protein